MSLQWVHQEKADYDYIISEEKLPIWSFCPQNSDHKFIPFLNFVELPDQCWDDLVVIRVVVISRTAEICWHHSELLGAKLPTVTPSHFEATDLGQFAEPVGVLQWADGEAFLFYRRRSKLGKDK